MLSENVMAYLFPGQGSQYVGMGRDIAKNFKIARDTFMRSDEILGFPLSKYCFYGPEEKLLDTSLTQPAVLTVSIACYEILKQKGLYPDYVAGHSLGEYSALVASGALEFEDAVKLVHKRGRYMQEAVPPGKGTMAAILGLKQEEVEQICQEVSKTEGNVEMANTNCPGEIVISGATEAVKKAMEVASQYGARKCVPLKVSGPFHSSFMSEAGKKLARDLEKIEIKPPRLPLVFNVNAEFLETPEEIRKALIGQVSSPVRWEESMRKLILKGVGVFIEVGSGRILTGLMRKINREKKVYHVGEMESLEKTLASLKEAG